MKKIIILISLLCAAQQPVAQTCNNSIQPSTPDSRFSVNGNEVTDHQTGLVWQRCSVGQSGSDCSGGSATRHTWPQALQLANGNWRLPNANELHSIVEERCSAPPINLTIFPNTPVSFYWSASPYAGHLGTAWSVYFGDGYVGNDFMLDNLLVRLVRSGQ